MSVHERRYHAYTGPRSSAADLLCVVPRYALADVFRSRALVAFFAASFFLPLLAMLLIYLRHNLNALTALNLAVANLLPIDSNAFRGFLAAQCLGYGFILTLVVAPGLLSGDFRNNALCLYLSRPFSRWGYLFGKMSVLALLLSAITWVPGLFLFGLQSYLDNTGWARANWYLAPAIFIGSWVWILLLSLIALTLTAWLRLRPLASGALIGVVIVGRGFAQIVNSLLETRWGLLCDVSALVYTVWSGLFRLPDEELVPVWSAWLVLCVIAGLCLFVLARKVRAYEVVR